MKIRLKNSDETIELGKFIAASLQAGDVVLLDGELGAGKTTLTKGIALQLGITRNVKSPTFTLIREYMEGLIPLYHMDMYRLENSDPFEAGVEEYINGDGISVIEWSEFIEELLPSEYLKVVISKIDDDQREAELIASGKRYENLIANIGKKYE